MVAYLAETSLVNLIKNKMAAPEQAKTLVRKLYQSDADMRVDKEKNC
jgi:hypothetical protein